MRREASDPFWIGVPRSADHLGRRRIPRAASEATNRLEIEAKPFMKGNPTRSVAPERASVETNPDVSSETHLLRRG